MRKRTNLIKKIWLMLFLCCLVGTALWNKTVHAETTYPFEKYYDPAEDEWGNEERVNMDGQLKFTVPDMGIVSMDLIVYGSADPQMDTLKNESGDRVVFEEKYSDDSTYTYYTVSDVSEGDWELQLREGNWESTRVYLIYQSSYTAKYTIDKELEDPDSGNYQALIRLYDHDEKELSLKNRKVQYLIDDYSLMSETTKDEAYNCYLGQPGLNKDQMNALGDDYSCHITVTAEDGTLVLMQAEKADKNEFKEIKSAYTPSLWQRFRAKPAEEQKTLVLMTGSLILFAILVVFLVKKTHVVGKRKEKIQKTKEERYQNAVRAAGKMQESLQRCATAREQIMALQEKLESYEVWVDSIYPEPVQRKYKKMISDEFFLILEQCGERVQNLKEKWGEMRQSRRGVPDAKEKEMQDAIENRRQMIEEIAGHLIEYQERLDQLESEISEFQKRKMFRDIQITVSDCGNQYRGQIEAMELGMPRRRGIQNLNEVILRGTRKILFDDLDIMGLVLSIGFTQSDSLQEMVLISNKELFCDDEDMEILRRQGNVQLGPYQYTQFEGLDLYMKGRKDLEFRITNS